MMQQRRTGSSDTMMLLAFVMALALAVLGAWFFVIRGSGGQGVVPVGEVEGPDVTARVVEGPGTAEPPPRAAQRRASDTPSLRDSVPRDLPGPNQQIPDRSRTEVERANLVGSRPPANPNGDTTNSTTRQLPAGYEKAVRDREGATRRRDAPSSNNRPGNRADPRSRVQPAGSGNLERRTSGGAAIPAVRGDMLNRTQGTTTPDGTVIPSSTGARYDTAGGRSNTGPGNTQPGTGAGAGSDYDQSGTYYNDGTGQTQPRPEQDYTDPVEDLIPYEERDPTLDEPQKDVPEDEEQVEEEPEPSEKLTGVAFLQVPPEIPVGTTVEVPVIIETGDRYLAAYGLDLAWDTSILSIDQVTSGAHFDPPAAINLEPEVGRLRFNGFTITPSSAGTISVATLTVTVRGAASGGSTTIRPSSSKQTIAVYDDDGTTPMEVKGAAFATATLTIK